jgi:hypothetical protein
MLDVLTVLAGVTAILIGTTAGAADVGSGVFRDLVATGRSRTALFAARIPADSPCCSRSCSRPTP